MTRRKVSEYNWDKLQFDETLLTKHFTPQDSKQVRYVVIHGMVILDADPDTDDALDKCYNVWQSRPASAQYGIDRQFIRQYVWDKDYAWAAGNTLGNRHGIHIEHANSTLNEPGQKRDYMMEEETWHNGAKLTAYIHKVYKMGRPKKDVTVRKHSSFFATACPGPFLGKKIWDEFNEKVLEFYDAIMDGDSVPEPKPKPKPKPDPEPDYPDFPLPSGHWYGVESSNPLNHSGYYQSDRPGIKEWQHQMKYGRGWKGIGAVDGIFGEKCETVCKQFQKEKGLKVDGAVGINTWRKSWTAKIT